MKKLVSSLLLLIVFFLLCSYYSAQSNNPFLSGKRPKENTYSSNKRTVLIVLDSSASMEDKIKSETKIHIAKRVLEKVLTDADSSINLGLRVYGSSKPTSSPRFDCNDSKLLVFPSTNNRRLIVSEAYKILPQGFTPITFSLSQAIKDLEPYQGEKSIILITDGLETCGGDPCQFSKELENSGADLKIDVVGFGIKDNRPAQKQLMCVALSTMGKYYSADSAEELIQGLSESINKSVTGRIISMLANPPEVESEESTEGYEHFPILTPEKLNLKREK